MQYLSVYPLQVRRWGKLTEKTFKKQQIIILFKYHRFNWLSAPPKY